MQTSSALLAIGEGNPSVTDGFPLQRSVTRSIDIFFDPPQKTVQQTIEKPLIWDAIALIMTLL